MTPITRDQVISDFMRSVREYGIDVDNLVTPNVFTQTAEVLADRVIGLQTLLDDVLKSMPTEVSHAELDKVAGL